MFEGAGMLAETNDAVLLCPGEDPSPGTAIGSEGT